MATVTLTISDQRPGDVVVRVESDPPFGLRDGEPDPDQLTQAQAAALFMTLALGDVSGNVDFRTLVRERGWKRGA